MLRSFLPKLVSYDTLILPDGGGIKNGKPLLRFESMWLKLDEFGDLVSNWLGGVQGSYVHVLVIKLQTSKYDLKSWKAAVIGGIYLLRSL